MTEPPHDTRAEVVLQQALRAMAGGPKPSARSTTGRTRRLTDPLYVLLIAVAAAAVGVGLGLLSLRWF